jgi:hypothetical protein
MTYTVKNCIDTRDNTPLWVLKIYESLSREIYLQVAEQLKKSGGYYSKFKKGFIFKCEPCNDLLNSALAAGKGTGAAKKTSAQKSTIKKGAVKMKNIFVGEKCYKQTVICENGAHDYYFIEQEDGRITNRYGSNVNIKLEVGTKYYKDGTPNSITILLSDREELLNTEKYVNALREYGLTEDEAIICLKKFCGKISRTYKKTAKDIMREANYRCNSYDDKYPPRGYYNSFLDNLRGICNIPDSMKDLCY